MKKIYDSCEFFAMFFMLLPTVLLVICGIVWVMRITIFPLLFPIGVVVAYVLAIRLTHRSLNSRVIIPVVGTLLLLVAMCFMINDTSWDGYAYHQPGIAALSEGWNPVYQHHYDPNGDNMKYIWVDHYAKGQETICATIAATFGNIETGKAGNFFLPISGFFFCLLAIGRKFLQWNNGKKVFVSFIVAFPPIIWNQVFTFYIDFVLYPIIVIAFCSVLIYENDKLRFGVVMASVVSVSIAVKFNIFMWTGLLYTGILSYMLIKRRYGMTRVVFFVGTATCVVSLFSFAYNPYITNTLDHKNPFYPLLGGQSIDIMTHVEPEAFKGLSAVEKVFVSDFSRPTGQLKAEKLQCPYSGYKLSNLSACGSADARLGGAGLFWVDCLLLSIIIFITTKTYKRRESGIYLLISTLFIATQFILPGGWFYRYVSYIYLIPMLLLFASEDVIKKKWQLWAKRLTYTLLFFNSLAGLTVSVGMAIVQNQIEDYYVKCINASDKPCYQSDVFGFVRKITPEKRHLNIKDGEIERIPHLPTSGMTGIKYENLNRNVKTTFMQDLLLEKGILK